MNCAACGKPLPPPPWFRRDECPACAASLHSCVHCVFYSPGQHNDCREPQSERAVDKTGANFCDYFKPGAPPGANSPESEKQKSLAALEALFKK